MKVETLANQNVPNGTNSEVTLFKDVSKDIICFKNKNGVVIPLGGGGLVYEGLTATGTSQATTKTTLNYGINVFTTITNINYAARLPIANTGQVVTVVNNTSAALSLHPSMAGGSINNTVNGIASVPPDGKAYSFYCIKNPLPGAWTWSAPATTQYISDVITIPSLVSGGSSATNPIYSLYNSTNYVNRGTSWGAFAEAENGKNKPLLFSNSSGVYFKFSPYATGIAKVKVYTNLLAKSTFALAGSTGSSYYTPGTGDFENNEYIVSGNLSVYQDTNNVIAGTPVGTYVSTNIGDPGTYYGELVMPTGIYSGGLAPTIVGDEFLGQVINPNTGLLADLWACGYLNFELKPLSALGNYGTISNVKIQFAIEYY
jgi:hypothetical protein